MKVLLVSLNYAPEPTGIAPYSTGLAEALADLGHDVRVLTGIPHYPEWRNHTGMKAWRHTTQINGVRVTRLRHYIPPGGTGLRRLLLELTFAAGVATGPWGRPDVVITVSPSLLASGAVTRLAKLRSGAPVVVWVQDLYSRGVRELTGAGGALGKMAAAVESAVLRGGASVVVIHQRFGELVSEQLRVPAGRVREIRNWSHVGVSRDRAAAAAIRDRLGWGDRPVVLHCGNMGAKQGLEAVVAAARQAEQRRSRTLFVLMGDGSRRAALEESAQGCANLQFVPPLPDSDFSAALAAADILLLNELQGVREMALPSKLTTYFATDKPVLAAVAEDGISAAEVRASGGGVVVPAGDSTALLDAVDKLMLDPTARECMAVAGQTYAEDTLSARGVVRRWESLLEELTNGRLPLQQTRAIPEAAVTTHPPTPAPASAPVRTS